MSPMRQTIARRLVEAQQNAALLTTFNECDMSAVKGSTDSIRTLSPSNTASSLLHVVLRQSGGGWAPAVPRDRRGS
ncbi:MAG: hypothetical protein R3B90_22730 [Planctomycetaceae bacterium]